MGIESWSTSAGNNALGGRWAEDQAPSSVNDGNRANMAEIKAWYDNPQWLVLGDGDGAPTFTRLSDTSFKLDKLAASDYHTDRRLKITNGTTTVLGTVTSSSEAAGETTVNVSLDSGVVPSGGTLTAYTAILRADESAIPGLSGTVSFGTAATKDTGTSGNNVPLLDGANTWSALNTFSSAIDVVDKVEVTDSDSAGLVQARSTRTDLATVGKFTGHLFNDSAAYVEAGGFAVTSTDRTAGSETGKAQIQTTRNGTQFGVVAEFADGVLIGSTTGGDKGPGTLNGTLYHNGTILGSAATVDTGTSSGEIPLLQAGGLLAAARLPAMVGATGVGSGTKGAVPQPGLGETEHVLRGDGSWALDYEEMTAQTIDSDDDSASVTHGFTTIRNVDLWLKRNSAGSEHGYGQGAYVRPLAIQTQSDLNEGISVWIEGTDVGASWHGGIRITPKTGTAPSLITNAEWRIVFGVWGIK